MHEDGIVAEVSERLQRAGLVPPVNCLIWQGDEENDDTELENKNESVLIDVTGPVSPELAAKLGEVLHGLAYTVRSVPPGHGVFYGGGRGFR